MVPVVTQSKCGNCFLTLRCFLTVSRCQDFLTARTTFLFFPNNLGPLLFQSFLLHCSFVRSRADRSGLWPSYGPRCLQSHSRSTAPGFYPGDRLRISVLVFCCFPYLKNNRRLMKSYFCVCPYVCV